MTRIYPQTWCWSWATNKQTLHLILLSNINYNFLNFSDIFFVSFARILTFWSCNILISTLLPKYVVKQFHFINRVVGLKIVLNISYDKKHCELIIWFFLIKNKNAVIWMRFVKELMCFTRFCRTHNHIDHVSHESKLQILHWVRLKSSLFKL